MFSSSCLRPASRQCRHVQRSCRQPCLIRQQGLRDTRHSAGQRDVASVSRRQQRRTLVSIASRQWAVRCKRQMLRVGPRAQSRVPERTFGTGCASWSIRFGRLDRPRLSSCFHRRPGSTDTRGYPCLQRRCRRKSSRSGRAAANGGPRERSYLQRGLRGLSRRGTQCCTQRLARTRALATRRDPRPSFPAQGPRAAIWRPRRESTRVPRRRSSHFEGLRTGFGSLLPIPDWRDRMTSSGRGLTTNAGQSHGCG